MRAHTRITLLHMHVHEYRWRRSEARAYLHAYMHVHGVSSAGLFEVIRVDEVQQRLQRERRHVSHLPSISRSYS
jgi:hypothetical protein